MKHSKKIKNVKITKKTLIIRLVIMLISLVVLGFVTVDLVKTIKERNAKQASSDLEFIEDENNLDNTEISIEELTNETNKTSKDAVVKENNNNPAVKTGKAYYYIRINYQANVVTIYGKDENNEYTVPIKAMICSTGRATPRSGTYTIKGRWEWLRLLGGVYGHYSTQITGNILFHSVPYLRKDPASLEYWEYDKLRNKCISWMC